MIRIGTLLREARRSKGLAITDVESTIKVKKEFLRALESENWNALPDFPVVTGFVKNYANFLGLDSAKAVALLRRDYPPQRKKEIKIKRPKFIFRISPRFTFTTGVIAGVVLIGSYLTFQYVKFTNPPELIIRAPVDGQVVFEPTFTVSGKISSDATIRVNNQPATIDADGNFEATLDLKPGEQEIRFEAINRSDKITTEVKHIIFNKDG